MKRFSLLIALAMAGSGFAQNVVNVSSSSNVSQNVYAYVGNKGGTHVAVGNGENDITFDVNVKTKTFSKTYDVGNAKQLNLTNKYGPIELRVWNRNEVKADIVMKATSDNEKDALALINGVSLEERQSSDAISIKTLLADVKGKYGTSIRNGKIVWKRELNISYVVYMPASLALSVNLQYGNLTLDDVNGPTNIKVQYGNLNGGNLNNANNTINVQYGSTHIKDIFKGTISQQYGKGVTVENANELNLNVQYASANINSIKNKAIVKVQYGGGLTIGAVGTLNLSAQYAPVKISNIKGDAVINQQYNSLNIGNANNLNLSSQYTSITIGELNGDANVKSTYNNLNIRAIKPSVRNLQINTSYVSVGLAFDDGYKGNVEFSGKYTGYNGLSSVKKINEEGSTKYYKGSIGGGGSNSVYVNAQYGSLSLK